MRSMAWLGLALTVAGMTVSCKTPRDVRGWQDTRWGMTSGDLEKLVKSGVTRLPEREAYSGISGGSHADYGVPKLEACGAAFYVHLLVSDADDHLVTVLIRHDEKRPFPQTSLFACLSATLTAKYGPPTRRTEDEVTWVFPTTTVRLESAYLASVFSMVTIFYFPTGGTSL